MPVLAARTRGKPLLDGSQAGLGEMLVGTGRRPEPGIVGDVQDEARARTVAGSTSPGKIAS